MSIDFRGITPGFHSTGPSIGVRAGIHPRPDVVRQEAAAQHRGDEIRQPLEELETLSWAFNRRLKFTINHDLDQVVVKVIDGETDKVIKELPPEALQRVHARIREAIGLLLDEEI